MKRRSDDPVFIKLLIPLPEDQLVPGEIELIQAHFARLIDQVFLPEDGSEIPEQRSHATLELGWKRCAVIVT